MAMEPEEFEALVKRLEGYARAWALRRHTRSC